MTKTNFKISRGGYKGDFKFLENQTNLIRNSEVITEILTDVVNNLKSTNLIRDDIREYLYNAFLATLNAPKSKRTGVLLNKLGFRPANRRPQANFEEVGDKLEQCLSTKKAKNITEARKLLSKELNLSVTTIRKYEKENQDFKIKADEIIAREKKKTGKTLIKVRKGHPI